ncbi:unnamed protein product [Prorocentrum cordatum]|uniref:Uncharacterized protein n=1 Tax=Prorocentrum cordatum TaxID=2364126 RepID=A0ABN9S9K0_9DINO|nr:unnamed protein product [Polarella glacialis]
MPIMIIIVKDASTKIGAAKMTSAGTNATKIIGTRRAFNTSTKIGTSANRIRRNGHNLNIRASTNINTTTTTMTGICIFTNTGTCTMIVLGTSTMLNGPRSGVGATTRIGITKIASEYLHGDRHQHLQDHYQDKHPQEERRRHEGQRGHFQENQAEQG